MNDYMEVFPDDFPRIPPDWEVTFEIDLFRGTIPISKAPYYMAHAKLKEFLIYLLELLDKGVHLPKLFSMGCTSDVCEKEG